MSNIEALVEKGKKLLDDVKFEEALECFNRSLEIDPRDTTAS